jgi:hypothetical protein
MCRVCHVGRDIAKPTCGSSHRHAGEGAHCVVAACTPGRRSGYKYEPAPRQSGRYDDALVVSSAVRISERLRIGMTASATRTPAVKPGTPQGPVGSPNPHPDRLLGVAAIAPSRARVHNKDVPSSPESRPTGTSFPSTGLSMPNRHAPYGCPAAEASSTG